MTKIQRMGTQRRASQNRCWKKRFRAGTGRTFQERYDGKEARKT